MRTAAAVLSVAIFAMSGSAYAQELPGVGPNPKLPEPQTNLLPTVNIAPAKSWPEGAKPTAASGLNVTAFAAGLVMLLASCSPPTMAPPSAGSSDTAGPASVGPTTATPSAPLPTRPLPTPPAGVHLLPTAFAVELEPGTYLSSPPFEVPFTFDVDDRGWKAGHLNGEFFDIQRFEGEPGANLPSRLVGFGRPDVVHGPDGEVPAPGLTPRQAMELVAAQEDLDSTSVQTIEIAGRAGARVDLHSETNNNHVFGGEDGDFGIGPELDVRLAVLSFEDGILVLLVSAPPGELGAAWDEATPIFDSIEALP